ncbi:MAG: hypothetical protein J5877_01470 [Clostridia bacterium]|nr:hypothetical protein [Clostridia bacterium]
MGKHPKLNKLDSYFEKGNDFALTDAQYEKLTGIPLPKGTDYLIKRSALSRVCKEKGYSITVQEKKVFFKTSK